MSAKRMRAVVCVAFGSLITLCLGHTAAAADTSNASAQTAAGTAGERLSREDVDRLLVLAQKAIKEGNLEQAEQHLRRAERAGIHYNFMYMGLQPATVRRELTKAQKERGPASRSTERTTAIASGTGSNPQSRTESADAAYQRPRTLPANGAGDTSLSAARTPSSDRASTDPTITNIRPAQSPNGNVVTNPFTPAGGSAAAGGRYGEASGRYSEANSSMDTVLQAGYGEGPTLGGPGRYDGSSSTSALPAAPLPSPLGAGRSAATSAGSSADLRQPADTSLATSPKEQTLNRLASARQALDAGNLELASKLVREASALGVPESQFLPQEDRPSLVAGDIAQAQQAGRGPSGRQPATRADLSAPLGGSRYADQAGPAIKPLSPTGSRPMQAISTPNVDARTGLSPDPLELPTETNPADLMPRPRTTVSNDPPSAGIGAISDASALMREGEAALRVRDRQTALERLGQAYALRDQLSAAEQQRLRDHLQMLHGQSADVASSGQAPRRLATSAGSPGRSVDQITPTQNAVRLPSLHDNALENDAMPLPSQGAYPRTDAGMLESTNAQGQVMARQLQAELGRAQTEARKIREQNPQQAMDLIKATRKKISDAQVAEGDRNQLLRRLDITQQETQQYIDEHRSEIELDQKNKAVLAEIDRGREVKLKIQQKTAEMVDEFNRLRDEQRYAEMEVVARRLYEMAPDDLVVQQIFQQSKFIRRTLMNRELADKKEDSFWKQMHATDRATVNDVPEDGRELVFNQKYWNDFAKDRKGSGDINRRNERELEIEHRLDTPVHLQYRNTPLSQVVDEMSQLAGINIHLDPRGLGQEGLESDTPVTIVLNNDVRLKSALRLILVPLHLSYVIKDEVLQITSDQISKGELKTIPYNVADLVVPIPNFVPSNNMGLQAMINDAYMVSGRGNGLGGRGPAVLVNGERGGHGGGGANANNDVLANQIGARGPGFPSTGSLAPTTIPVGGGPGGMGGGANADFDSLIELITATVAPESWAESGGGTAEVRAFPTNLSLVISQTQAVHQEIADLLEQLRRLQDLQVTIEMRFIRLNEGFFERIGIDFDMNIEDRTIGTADLVPGTFFEGRRQTATVGLSTPTGVNDFPRFTADLDVPFRQRSFDLTQVTPFGSAQNISTFGFAILSDNEAYFLIEAAQGDSRTNVLNAPKVTLFNGQQAFVTDNTQQPFVVGVIPVVGEFVAAQQPVIVVLNEGTMLTIQAVVSDDRRYVRLTVVPYFTQIGNVDTFTFEGASSTTSSSSTTDDDNNGKNEKSDKKDEQTRSGVTVQLPSFSVVSVTTTVSVPDGGTVLLGGIKRLSEGRNEFGVPLLSKIPYINRLFKNVSIGRDTDSLMMMVTPRIIIQEEEEERLGIVVP